MACYAAIALALGVVARRAAHDFGAVFNIWDDIVSWNRWALDFAAGRMPSLTWEYPQLLPSIWSIFYVETGVHDLQIFIKCLAAWLPVVQLVVFAAMWREDRTLASVMGAIFAAALLCRTDFYAVAAYAEIPAGTIAFLSFYAAWLSSRREGREADKIAWVGAALVAAATLTKQAGGLFLVVYPVFLLAVSAKTPERRRRVLVSIGIALALALPWYVYRECLILTGREVSNLRYLTSTIHEHHSLAQRFWISVGYLREWLDGFIWLPSGFSTSLWYISFAASLFALGSRMGRLVLLSTIVPYFLIYAFFFGYDERNLMAISPFLAWSNGIGVANAFAGLRYIVGGRTMPGALRLASFGQRQSGVALPTMRSASPSLLRLIAIPLACMIMLSIGVAHWASGWPTEAFLAKAQAAALLNVGGKGPANKAVRGYLEQHPDTGLVATNFMPATAIPLVAQHFFFTRFTSRKDIDLLVANPKVGLVLDVGKKDFEMTPEGTAALDASERDGTLSRVASGSEWRLLKIVR